MKKFDKNYKNIGYLIYWWVKPLIDLIALAKGFVNYPRFFRDILRYKNLPGAEEIKLINAFPCILDKTNKQSFDSHYFYQDVWAFRKIQESGVQKHVDVGSRIDFVGFLSAICDVDYVDIRPFNTDLKTLKYVKGDILKLPYETNSIFSLSCLHVAEHIGLGRYGDELNPNGTRLAIKELVRILKPGCNLYFSLPVGKPRLCFNSHRIHSPNQILKYFPSLKLIEFSAITDDGKFIEEANLNEFEESDYACGLFHFTK